MIVMHAAHADFFGLASVFPGAIRGAFSATAQGSLEHKEQVP